MEILIIGRNIWAENRISPRRIAEKLTDDSRWLETPEKFSEKNRDSCISNVFYRILEISNESGRIKKDEQTM